MDPADGLFLTGLVVTAPLWGPVMALWWCGDFVAKHPKAFTFPLWAPIKGARKLVEYAKE